MWSSEEDDEECDARDDDSSAKAGNQIKIINKKRMTKSKKQIHPDSYRDILLH